MSSAADFLVLCLPVGFGQWGAEADSEGERIISLYRIPGISASTSFLEATASLTPLLPTLIPSGY